MLGHFLRNNLILEQELSYILFSAEIDALPMNSELRIEENFE